MEIKMENNKEEWKKFWSEFAINAYDNLHLLQEYKKMQDKISSFVGRDKHVLDSGCGTGNLTVRLAKNNKVTAIDFSLEMLKVTKEKTKGFNNITIKEGDVTSLDFEDNSFDVVVSVNVLFNLDKPEKAIQETNRVLKNNGSFIVSTPLAGAEFNKELSEKVIADSGTVNANRKKVMEALYYNKILFKKGGMKFVPTENQISELFEHNGFKILMKERIYFGCNLLINAIKV